MDFTLCGFAFVLSTSAQLTKPFCKAITGGAVHDGDWAVALRQTIQEAEVKKRERKIKEAEVRDRKEEKGDKKWGGLPAGRGR